MVRKGHLLIEYYEIFQRVIEAQDTYCQMEIKRQDHRAQSRKGSAPNLFDWTRIEQASSFLQVPLPPDGCLVAFYFVQEFVARRQFGPLFLSRCWHLVQFVTNMDKGSIGFTRYSSSVYWGQAWTLQKAVLASDPPLHMSPQMLSFGTLV